MVYKGSVAFSAGCNLQVGGIGMEYVVWRCNAGVSEWREEAGDTGRRNSYGSKKNI